MNQGRMVLIHGLKNRVDLNGTIGCLLSEDKAAGRWGVQIDGESVRIRPCNLTVTDAVTLMPPEDESATVMRASISNLESAGPVIVSRNPANERIRRDLNLPSDAIIKSVVRREDGVRYTLSFDLLKQYLQTVDIGSGCAEVRESFSKGVYLALNHQLYLPTPRAGQPQFCVLVGDAEFIPERDRLFQQEGCNVEMLDSDIPPRPLPGNRCFSILGFDLKNVVVSYIAFVQDGCNNIEQHLLPMVLTDTHYVCNAVFIYACLRL